MGPKPWILQTRGLNFLKYEAIRWHLKHCPDDIYIEVVNKTGLL